MEGNTVYHKSLHYLSIYIEKVDFFSVKMIAKPKKSNHDYLQDF